MGNDVALPITRISSEKTVKEIASIFRNIDPFGELVVIVQNSLVGGINVTGVDEWSASYEGAKRDDADGPYVDLKRWEVAIGAASLGLDGLWSHIGGRSTAALDDGGAPSIGLGSLKLLGEAEIGELELHILVEQEVCRLDIAVDDVTFVMQIL